MNASRTSVYLDYNATAPLRPEAKDALLRALESPANPSSVHAAGRAARDVVERARAEVAALVGVPAGSITFVSGGTEGNALAIESAKVAGVERIILSAIEHDAVTETAKASGLPVEVLPVDNYGVADLGWLAQALEKPGKALVCLMLANNEIGVIQPVDKASALVRAHDGWLHVDAVQAAGKIAIDFSGLGADTMALSAHKLGGPQGVGALVAGTRATVTRRLSIYPYVLSYGLDDPKVSYCLEGFDREPVISSKEDLGQVSYTNLRGGTYTFRLNLEGESEEA
ncbi:aminotransferase class V-fold PLP-dependent enzyme, partial [Caulobacter sp.]|uniref:aminotransferase class V-fold PLP-dependent enzyme n=1 Tax=Caulobacter sp. TaxID=78 RepID=UPI0025C691BF